MKLSELRFSRLRVFVFGQSNTVFLITFWQWQLINYWDDCHLELIPRPSSTTEMNFPRVFECENAWFGRSAQSDKKREVLIAFFERTPPGTHVRGSQTKLSNIDLVAFNVSQRPDRFS